MLATLARYCLRTLNRPYDRFVGASSSTPLFSFESLPQDSSTGPAEDEKDSGTLFAVPKRRVAHARKRLKYFQKNIKPIESFKTCPHCGEQQPNHIQLCPFCYRFNAFLRSKDLPAKLNDRRQKLYQIKVQRESKSSSVLEAARKIVQQLSNAVLPAATGDKRNGET